MYCDIDDLISNGISEENLVRLTDDEQTGSYNTTRANDAITSATDEINGYCLVKYGDVVPFSPVPGLIKKLCIDISIYNLHQRREAVSEQVDDRYKKAVAILEKISKGTVKLLADDEQVSEDSVNFSIKTSADRKFKDPRGYFE